MNNEKCVWCGKATVVAGQKYCSDGCYNADYQEPDFERLLELKNDYDAFKRDGGAQEWAL